MDEKIREFIDQSKYSEITHNVNGVYFFIDPNWKKIAVNVSGGADSAMLLFILCKIIKEQNYNIEVHTLSHIRLWKTRPWQIYDARRVINFIKNFYPNINIVQHENYMAPELNSDTTLILNEHGDLKSGDRIMSATWADYICFTYKIPIWYAGITQNPDDDLNMKPFDRNDKFQATENNLKKLIVLYDGIYNSHPFSFTNKKWIMEQYKFFDILDLLKLTRSCEGDNKRYPEIFKGLDYKTYKPNQDVPECNDCFWCQERHWGMKKIFGQIIK